MCTLIEFDGKEDFTQTTNALSTIVTAEMCSGVLDEVVGLLPVILPVAIGFIAIRKGVSFVLGMLRAA